MAYRMAVWQKGQPAGTHYRRFWVDRLPTNIITVVVTTVAMGMWLAGELSGVTGKIHAMIVHWGDMTADEHGKGMAPTWYLSLGAGFLVTYFARWITKRITERAGNGDSSGPWVKKGAKPDE
jgi:hypothetical protein